MRRIVDNPRRLGVFLRDARIKEGMTQEELSAKSGVSRSWIIAVEKGTRPGAEISKIFAVCSALNVQLSGLWGEDAHLDCTEVSVRPQPAKTPEHEPEKNPLERAYQNLYGDLVTAPLARAFAEAGSKTFMQAVSPSWTQFLRESSRKSQRTGDES